MTDEPASQSCFQLRIGTRARILRAGQTIAAPLIAGLQPLRQDGIVAAIDPSVELGGALAITNWSREDWRLTLPDDERFKLPPGLRTRLVDGTSVDFGGVTGMIVFAPEDKGSLALEPLAAKPFHVSGRACWTKPELGAALAANWAEALRIVASPAPLADWLRTSLGDAVASEQLLELSRLTAAKSLTAADLLSLFLPRLDPSLPPIVAGQALTAARLVVLARAAGTDIAQLPAVLRLDHGLASNSRP